MPVTTAQDATGTLPGETVDAVVVIGGGVWVAGNATDLTAQVGASAAAGALAGAHINAGLAMADTDAALPVGSRRPAGPPILQDAPMSTGLPAEHGAG